MWTAQHFTYFIYRVTFIRLVALESQSGGSNAHSLKEASNGSRKSGKMRPVGDSPGWGPVGNQPVSLILAGSLVEQVEKEIRGGII